MPDEQGKLSREAGFLPETETSSIPEAVEDVFDVGEQTEQQFSAQSEALPETPLVQEEVGAVAPPHVEKEPLLARVETVLEGGQGIANVYNELPEDKKVVFRVKGEAAARKIREMIASGKPRRYATMKVVREWLRVIPKANHAWVEQTVSVAADEIDKLAEDKRNAA